MVVISQISAIQVEYINFFSLKNTIELLQRLSIGTVVHPMLNL